MTEWTTETITLLVLGYLFIGSVFGLAFWYNRRLNKKINEDLKNQLTKSVSTRKSSEVRLGTTAENFAPLLAGYPYDPYHFRFIGGKIDGIQFNDDSIIIIEFKSGNAKLSTSQKNIKQLVDNGKVRFETFRMDEKGTTLTEGKGKNKKISHHKL